MRDLFRASRPFSWINTALPCLAAGYAVGGRLTPALLLSVVYFLAPYNLLLYGVNDIFDYESDRLNPRKGGDIEGGLVSPERRRSLLLWIVVANAPLALAVGVLGSGALRVMLPVTVAVAVAYSASPLRTKVVPFLDSLTSSLHFVLPAVCGALAAGAAPGGLPWRYLAAFLCWGMASQAMGAIQDVEFDRAAGIGSIATWLGRSRTAVYAVVLYSIAWLLTATGGAAALVVSIALLPYPLLAASCLGGPLQARRAWKSFLALNLLAGFWITQVLLRVFGIAQVPLLEVLASGSLAGAGTSLLMLWLNLRAIRFHRGPAGRDAPSVAVIIPARNEQSAIADCVRSVAAQPSACEVIVVDDSSSDLTAQVATAALAGRGRVVAAGVPPAGWSGKCWAAALGARLTSSPYLVFVDADTVLAPGAVSAMVRALDAQGGGIVSALTRYDLRTPAEKILMPAFAVLQLAIVPLFLLNRSLGRFLPLAYGPCVAVTRDAYRRSGGHEGIAQSDRDDVDLAQRFAAVGLPVRLVDGSSIGTTRHFTDVGAITNCWRRTWYAYTGHSLGLALTGTLGIAAVELLPLATLAFSLVTGDRVAAVASSLASLLILATRSVVAVRQRQSVLTVLWHPVTFAFAAAAQLLSIFDGLTGRPASWRGRRLLAGVT